MGKTEESFSVTIPSMARKSIGRCKLTGEVGPFVKSHLLPRALTLPRSGGEAFPQIHSGERPKKRRDSWYDLQLVTQAGEDILTSYDTFGISELRRLKLIWQSWGPMCKLATADHVVLADGYGMRRITFSDPPRMRLFLLSLLWRAAASELSEFQEISLSFSDLRRLRNVVCFGRVPTSDFFPASLIQLSELGIQHNHGPFRQVKKGVRIGNYRSRDLKIFRFYFDGLIVHFHVRPQRDELEGMEPSLVGHEGATMLNTVPTSSSWQLENLVLSMLETESAFPGAIQRTGGIF